MNHNILPDIVPKIIAVLDESIQCSYSLSRCTGCYCFLGAICEAFIRDHPGKYRWEPDIDGRALFDVEYGVRYRGCAPVEIREWATGKRHTEIYVDDRLADGLNDAAGWSFEKFKSVLLTAS